MSFNNNQTNNTANNIVSAPGLKENTKITPKEIVFKYLIYLPLFVLTLALSISVAYIYLRYKIPMYSSSLSLLIKDETKSGGSDALLDNLGIYKKKANLSNEIEVLRSASLMKRVVDTLKLNLQYFSTGQVKRSEMYHKAPFTYETIGLEPGEPYSFTLKFDGGNIFQINGAGRRYKSGEVISENSRNFKIDVINPSQIKKEYTYYVQWNPSLSVAQGLSSQLAVKQLNREASILKLSIETEVPQKGRDILDQLIVAYNRNNVEDKNKIVDNTLKFIDERLYLLTNELGRVEQGLKSFRERNEVIDIGMQGSAQFSASQTTEQKLNEQEVKLRIVNMISEYINNPQKKFTRVPSTLGVEDPTLSALTQQYNQLQLEREEKLQTMPAENPIVRVYDNQIEKIRESIGENLKNIQLSFQTSRNKTLGEYNALKSSIRNIPAQQKQQLEITRQQGIKENLFLFLLQKREESAITRASAVANATALDPAVSGYLPVQPNKSNTYNIALLLGILIPVAIIYIIDLLKDKIVTRQDITKLTRVPILGEIAHHPERNRQWVVGVQDRSILAEQFRIIRTNLQYFIANKKSPILLITSSIAGEGKTFTSMNIGAVWSVANKKTVILELDLRKPKISTALNLENPKGISNYMLGQISVEQLPVAIEGMANLYIVPAGPIPPNPSELLMDNKIDLMFQYLRENFDLIVIDSAPIGLVSDTKILSRFADATLYVVRQRYTLKKQLNFVEELYKDNVLPSMGLLVNDVKMGGVSSYYGYGYGYGYGYNSNYNYQYGKEQNISWWKKIMNYYR